MELFGHDPNSVARRLDTAGLVTLLRGRLVIELDGDTATIMNRGGNCHRFGRMPLPAARFPAIGSISLWSWLPDVGIAH